MAENQTFGEWLRHRRREMDLTQSELGGKVGCAQVTIKKIEANTLRPSRQLAQLLIEKLDVPPEKEELFIHFARGGKYPEDAQPNLPRNNFPIELTSFIGRTQEIAEVIQLLGKERLVTVTGAGGVGKSRLALQVAARVMDRYPDGAWFVELATVTNPETVPLSAATALGLQKTSVGSYQSMLVQYLQKKNLLLILDNCEHLSEACAQLVYALLLQCPQISILATCRETLDVEGEVNYRLPSLTNLDPIRTVEPGELKKTDSVRLFAERAAAILPDFSLTNKNLPAVARICYRLDGIPLAIELAAARISALSAEQIAERLDDRFRLLIIGNRTALPRHRTLRASIDWSYNLLPEVERLLLQRLSVFAGGWTLEAAEAICSSPVSAATGSARAWEGLEKSNICDALTGLVKKSLIQTIRRADGLVRFTMLETIRQYAHEKLSETGQVRTARDHHLVYFLRLVEEVETGLWGRELIQTLNLLEIDLDNLRLALEWGLQTNVEAELKMAAALQRFWHIRSLWFEAIDWLERGLAEQQKTSIKSLDERQCNLIRAKALTSLGFHLLEQNISAWRKNQSPLEEALAFYHADNPETNRDLAWTLVWLGLSKFYEGDFSQSNVFAQKALGLFLQARDAHGMAEALEILAHNEGDLQRELEIYSEQLAIVRASGDAEGIATALQHIGMTSFQNGYYEKAKIAFEESQAYYRKVRNPIKVATLSYMLASTVQALGDRQHAEEYNRQSIKVFTEVGNDLWGVWGYFWLWMWAIAEGRFDIDEGLNHAASSASENMPDRITDSCLIYIFTRMARLQGKSQVAQTRVQKLPVNNPLALLELGYLAMESGDLKQAGRLWREGIRILKSNRERFWLFFMLDPMAMLAIRENQAERAARLCGTRWCRGFFHFLSPGERDQRNVDFTTMRSALGETRFEELYEEGRLLSLDQAVTLALEENK